MFKLPNFLNNMNNRKLGIIIQARVGSIRLPNKINLPFYRNNTILDIIIKKLLQLNNSIPIVLSTGDNKENNILKNYSDKYNIEFFQGNEINVLDRFIRTSEAFSFTHVIRVCSDNPFLNLNFINQLIDLYEVRDYDYYSYKDNFNVPAIRTHLGLFVEIVSLSSLKVEEENEKNINIIEHVTKYVYENPQKFKIYLKKIPDFLNKDLRFTIDDQDDFDNLRKVYVFYAESDLEKTIEYIEEKEEIKNKMLANVKKYTK